jgi:ribonuclease HII
MGFNDSKQLKQSERQDLLDKIIQHPSIGWVVEELTAEYISEVINYLYFFTFVVIIFFESLVNFVMVQEMLKPTPVSLNQISYDAVIRALSHVRDVNPKPPYITDIFIDTVGM